MLTDPEKRLTDLLDLERSDETRVDTLNRFMGLREMLCKDPQKGFPFAATFIALLNEAATDEPIADACAALTARERPNDPVWVRAAWRVSAHVLRWQKYLGERSPCSTQHREQALNVCLFGWLYSGYDPNMSEEDVLFAAARLCSQMASKPAAGVFPCATAE